MRNLKVASVSALVLALGLAMGIAAAGATHTSAPMAPPTATPKPHDPASPAATGDGNVDEQVQNEDPAGQNETDMNNEKDKSETKGETSDAGKMGALDEGQQTDSKMGDGQMGAEQGDSNMSDGQMGTQLDDEFEDED
jgi:hypothetical protein